MSKSSSEVMKEVAELIITEMENGKVPWIKPWNEAKGNAQENWPHNAISKRRYHGGNVWWLDLLANSAGYPTAEWLTFNQCKKAGGTVRKGEKGTQIIYMGPNVSTDKEGKEHVFWIERVWTVFNVAQCDGLNLAELPKPEDAPEFEEVPDAETIISRMPNKPGMRWNNEGRAYYEFAADRVTLPQRELFKSTDEYYSTAFHELTHSTGHKSRLNRHLEDEVIGAFGSAPYSREELVAEFGAAFLCRLAGIDNTSVLKNSAAYINSWLDVIRKEPEIIFWASSRAERAANYVLGNVEVQTEKEAA